MEFEEKYATISVPSIRPQSLIKLCIFSFFFSGGMTLFSFGGMFFSGWLANYLNEYGKGFYNIGISIFLLFFLCMFILFGSSLIGAILMFRMKRSGFWIYLTANAIMLFLAFFVDLGIFNAVFIFGTILFIILYIRQYKYLKK